MSMVPAEGWVDQIVALFRHRVHIFSYPSAGLSGGVHAFHRGLLDEGEGEALPLAWDWLQSKAHVCEERGGLTLCDVEVAVCKGADL